MNPHSAARSWILALAAAAAIAAPGAPVAAETASDRDPNRLINETSPYLRQHARNPVDWYPWGEEAFRAARERGVPIIVSVGYSTCYWCHVMERECFEDEAIAELMNRSFVCVKVDREERPDVDDIYMAAVQLMTRSGGWPMNVFLTPPGARGPDDPGLEPFYGGTYFPPEPRQGIPSWPAALEGIRDAWATDRAKVLQQAGAVTDAVRAQLAERSRPVRVDAEQISIAIGQLGRSYDQADAGFGGAPKFPQPVYLSFLMDIQHTIADAATRSLIQRALRHTMDRMATGGIYDHVGGGFHRYSTDARWRVPHFEKMLYDNGQLAALYAESFARTRDPYDAWVLRGVLEYVLREMTSDEGLFYSAQDAEVNAREGQNYLWTRDQVLDTLGPDDGAWAANVLGLDDGPNFTDPHHPEEGGKNVLFLRARPEQLAEELGIEIDDLYERLVRTAAVLLKERDRRDQPGLDDKVIVAWNGLMIRGLAMGSMAMADLRYLDAAERASRVILQTMRDRRGHLLRTSRNGVAGPTPGFLEDYAFLISGLLETHRANAMATRAELTFLNSARDLVETAYDLFEDRQTGGLFDTLDGRPDLIVRASSSYDGALPTGQSVMLHNLIDLYELTRDERYWDRAVALVGSMSADIKRAPVGSVNATRALFRMLLEDPDFPDAFGTAEAEDTRSADAEVIPDRVRVLAAADRIRVAEDRPVRLAIRIEMDEGFHINTNRPDASWATPLEIWIEGSEAVDLKVSYPPGTRLPGPPLGDLAPPMVYEGMIELTLQLERTDAKWTGRPIILLRYQACNESECLPPRTVELDVAIDP